LKDKKAGERRKVNTPRNALFTGYHHDADSKSRVEKHP